MRLLSVQLRHVDGDKISSYVSVQEDETLRPWRLTRLHDSCVHPFAPPGIFQNEQGY